MKQDVEFFGKYGFSDPILMLYGAIQLIGGILLPFKKTKLIGAAVAAITFAVSLIVLLLEGNIPVSIVTTLAIVLLGFVMIRTRRLVVAS